MGEILLKKHKSKLQLFIIFCAIYLFRQKESEGYFPFEMLASHKSEFEIPALNVPACCMNSTGAA